MLARLALAVLIAAAPCAALADPDVAMAMHQAAGMAMQPAEVAGGPWSLSSGGHIVCSLSLGDRAAGGGLHHADIPSDCGAELPTDLIGWKPSADGLALVARDGQVIDFNLTTPRDLVAHSGRDGYLELTRPAP